MTGKDLFEGMSYVEEELISEAENKAWKKRPLPVRQWCAAAACVGVLAVSVTAVTMFSHFNGSGGANKSADTEMAGGAYDSADETAKEEAAAQEAPESSGQETPESGGAGTSDGTGRTPPESSGQRTADKDPESPAANEAPEEQEGDSSAEDTKKQDTADAAGGESEKNTGREDAFSAEDVLPEAGQIILDDPVVRSLQAHAGEDARFLLEMELYDGKTPVAQDSSAYRGECERLGETGVEWTKVSHWTKAADGGWEEQTVTAGIFTAKQLENFPAGADYGYRFAFVTNADGSPFSFEGDAVTGEE